MRLNPTHEALKRLAIDRFDAAATTRPDTVVFQACPFCHDDKGHRHRLNVVTGYYWCYRNQCTCRWPRLFAAILGLPEDEVLRMLGEGNLPHVSVGSGENLYDVLFDRLYADYKKAWEDDKLDVETNLPSGFRLLAEADQDDDATVAVAAYLAGRDFKPASLGRICGLVNTKYYPTVWTGRVIFPVRDKDGEIKGCVGRSIVPGVEPRYYSSVAPDHPVWGLDLAVPPSHLVLTEGIFSALAVTDRDCGVHGIASLGKAFGPDKARLILGVKPSIVTVLLDPDVKGGDIVQVVHHLREANSVRPDKAWIKVGLMPRGGGDPADEPAVARAAVEEAMGTEGSAWKVKLAYGY